VGTPGVKSVRVKLIKYCSAKNSAGASKIGESTKKLETSVGPVAHKKIIPKEKRVSEVSRAKPSLHGLAD